jgi:hypothetical protein
MDETDRKLVDPLQVVDGEHHGIGRRQRAVRSFEDTQWVARLLSISSEHELTQIPAGSGDLHELAEQSPGGRERDGLDRLEPDDGTQPSELGAVKDLGEEAALAASGLARDKCGRRQSFSTGAAYQLGKLIELIPTADEGRAHGKAAVVVVLPMLTKPQVPSTRESGITTRLATPKLGLRNRTICKRVNPLTAVSGSHCNN